MLCHLSAGWVWASGLWASHLIPPSARVDVKRPQKGQYPEAESLDRAEEDGMFQVYQGTGEGFSSIPNRNTRVWAQILQDWDSSCPTLMLDCGIIDCPSLPAAEG